MELDVMLVQLCGDGRLLDGHVAVLMNDEITCLHRGCLGGFCRMQIPCSESVRFDFASVGERRRAIR